MTLPEQIDVSNAGQIREALLSVINRGATSLIADMSATISCDYAGADSVARASRRAILTGTELRLVVTAQIVRRVLSTSGLDRLVAIYPSLKSAAAARAPAVVALAGPGRPGEPLGGRRATAENGGPQDPSTAVAPAVIRQMVDAFQDGVALADDHGTITLANRRLDTETAQLEDLAAHVCAAVTAGPDRRAPDLLDTIVTALFHVGLSLQASMELSAEATRPRITEALGHLEEVIRQIRDTAFTSGDHQDTPG